MRKFISICIALLLMVSLAVSVSAAEGTPYVIDDAQLLTPEECQELNAYAEKITNQYGIGVYMMSVLDYRDYGEEYEIYDVLWNYYHDNKLGYGSGRQGMILMLSMEDRDYATFYYGVDTEYAFNDYGQMKQEGYFLDNFGEDDWYGGFMDYLDSAENFMAKAEAGDPVRKSPAKLVLLFIGIACFISFIVTMIMLGKMRNVAIADNASHYVVKNSFVMHGREDIFIRQEVHKRRIERDSNSKSHSGGGGSGRSGNF